MLFHYSAFGLSLTTDQRLPGVVPRPTTPVVDTNITLGSSPYSCAGTAAAPWYVSDECQDGTPTLSVWRLDECASFCLLYSDGTEFVVDRDGRKVWATWPPTSTLEDTATYLLGPVLGFVLRLRGVTCLHASAVRVGDRAIALMGPAGAGKSTTAAALAQCGYPVLTDDVVALGVEGNDLLVQPGYPQLRLWPDSVAQLFGREDALPPLTPTWDKRALDLIRHGQRFQDTPLPLAAIYVLEEWRDADAKQMPRDADGRIEPLSGASRLMTLVGNTYVGYLLDTAMRRDEFATLSRVAATLPVKRVIADTGRDRTAQLCASILGDCESI